MYTSFSNLAHSDYQIEHRGFHSNELINQTRFNLKNFESTTSQQTPSYFDAFNQKELLLIADQINIL